MRFPIGQAFLGPGVACSVLRARRAWHVSTRRWKALGGCLVAAGLALAGRPAQASPAVWGEAGAVVVAGGSAPGAGLFVRTNIEDPGSGLRLFLEGRGDSSREYARYGVHPRVSGGMGLGEAYAEAGSGLRLRLGQFRVPFGIYERGESDYFGFIQMPMARAQPTTDYYSSYAFARLSSGVQVSGGSPELSYRVAVVDRSDRLWESRPGEMTDVVARVQTYADPWILGLSTYQGHVGTDALWWKPGPAARARWWGVDWRYTTTGLMLRGEYIAGRVGGRSPTGAYVDAVLHPAWMGKSSLLFRYERYSMAMAAVPGGRQATEQVTAGAKWMPFPWLLLAANAHGSGGWPNGGDTQVLGQAVVTRRF